MTLSVVVFSLEGARCALPLAAAREVLPWPELSRPPQRPAILEGFLDLGGQAVPVLRMDRLLGLPEVEWHLYLPLLLADLAGVRAALVVKEVLGVRPAGRVLPVGESDTLNGCVEGRLDLEGLGPVHLLSPERLLLARERAALEDLRRLEQERLAAMEGTT